MRNQVDHTQIQDLDWISALTGEMLLFGLLSKIIYSEPDEAWLNSLIAQDVFSEVPLGADEIETQQGLDLLRKWVNEQNGSVSKAALDVLKADYLTLFIGPGKMHAPLWESVYFSDEHLVFQERTLDVRKWYRRFGLEVERLNAEPDDHIGLELAFMSRLTALALKAGEENNAADFGQFLAAQREFFSEHLLQWGPAFSALVIEKARTDFYRGIGHLTLGSLMAVAKLLQLEAPAKALK